MGQDCKNNVVTAPGVALGAKSPLAGAGEVRDHGFHPWVRKIPWRRAWQPTPVFLSRESRGQRSLAGYSPWGLKESDTTEATDHIGCKGKVTNRCLDI